MPRLTKIRISGCKYDKFRKRYENSIFDLTRDGEPDHTLLTLKNQGGKGVLMQLISQIVLPETKWGKRNGNKITSMFYDQRNTLRNYTFHVLLEWKLDEIPEKWLVTGMCITSVKRNDSKDEDEEEKAGINYFLYTHEHDNSGPFHIENIPAYDKVRGESVDYKEFEKFINDNSRDFIKFSQSSSKRSDSDYYNYLGSKGIYRSEWEILKEINRVEGGIGEYFSKAVDNKSIFDKLIIPAISQNMGNFVEEDSNSLRDMFKSHLSITKNLPKLLAREGDYKNLIYFIEPLIKDADTGIRRFDMLNRSIQSGNNLYSAFENKQGIINKELEKWNAEEIKSSRKKYELDFQRENLEYAKLYKDTQELYVNLKKYKDKDDLLNTNLEEISLDIRTYEINKLRIPKEDLQKQKENKIKEKERFIESMKLDDVKEEIIKVEKNIFKKWESTSKTWANISKKHFSYMEYLKNQIKKLVIEEKKLKDLADPIKININRFEGDKDNLEKRKAELSLQYDMFKMNFPEQFLEELNIQDEEEKNKIYKNEEKADKLKEELENLNIEKNSMELKITSSVEKIKELNKQYNNIKTEEESIRNKIVSMLNLDEQKEVYRESWVKLKSQELYSLVEEKEKNKIKLNKELWENNIDKALNNRDYWIPNSDILTLKQHILNLGIKVQLGTEFLRSESNLVKREEYLKNYPIMIYGVVIGSDREWEIIRNNIKKDILLHNPVPIFIRSNMNIQEDNSFRVVNNEGNKFVLNEEFFLLWKKGIQDRDDNTKEGISIIENKIESIRSLIKDTEILLDKESSRIIVDRTEEEKNILDDLRDAESNVYTSIEKLKNKIKMTNEDLKDLEKQNKNTNINKLEIEKFVDRKKQIEGEEKNIIVERQRLEKINKEIDEANSKIVENKEHEGIEEINYAKWEMQVKERLARIKEVVLDAKLVNEKTEIMENAEPPSYSFMDDDIFDDLEYRSKLSMEFEQKNLEIKNINKDIEILNEKTKEKEDQLIEIDEKWNQYDIIDKPIEVILIKLKQLKGSKNKLDEEIQEVKNNLLIIDTRIDGNNKTSNGIIRNIKERYPEKAVLSWEGEDLSNKEYEIKKDMEDNKKYLNQVKEIIDKFKKSEDKVKNIILEIKRFEELDSNKGKIDEKIMEAIENNPQEKLEKWIADYKEIKHRMKKDEEVAKDNRESFNREVKNNIRDDILKNRILKEMEGLNITNYKSNLISFSSMQEHFNKEINKIDQDKSKAEEVRNQWAKRAARHGIRMIESLKEMVASVVYLNERGYSFPLVKLKGDELLPKDEEDVIISLKEYFVECIERLINEYEDVDEIEEKRLDILMNDRAIFSKTVRGRYPKLMVYKMTEKNEFKYAKPRDYYYETWEAINKGEGVMTEGSGGQTLSIGTFVIMMLMNYKKRYVGNKNPWTVLMLDNIVGKASGKHVLDPIFEIANKLNFQLLTFAAPEIIKAEISERFPVFWALKIAEEKDNMPGAVTGRVIHGGRINIANK